MSSVSAASVKKGTAKKSSTKSKRESQAPKLTFMTMDGQMYEGKALDGTKPHKPIRTNGQRAHRLLDELNGKFASISLLLTGALEAVQAEKERRASVPGATLTFPEYEVIKRLAAGATALGDIRAKVHPYVLEGVGLLDELSVELIDKGVRP